MKFKITETEIEVEFEIGDKISAITAIEDLKNSAMNKRGSNAVNFMKALDGKRLVWVKDAKGKERESLCMVISARAFYKTEVKEEPDGAGYTRTIIAQYQEFHFGTKYERNLYEWYRITGLKLKDELYVEKEKSWD